MGVAGADQMAQGFHEKRPFAPGQRVDGALMRPAGRALHPREISSRCRAARQPASVLAAAPVCYASQPRHDIGQRGAIDPHLLGKRCLLQAGLGRDGREDAVLHRRDVEGAHSSANRERWIWCSRRIRKPGRAARAKDVFLLMSLDSRRRANCVFVSILTMRGMVLASRRRTVQMQESAEEGAPEVPRS